VRERKQNEYIVTRRRGMYPGVVVCMVWYVQVIKGRIYTTVYGSVVRVGHRLHQPTVYAGVGAVGERVHMLTVCVSVINCKLM
jgi:hypothetical protein